jgi:hypothetical protein
MAQDAPVPPPLPSSAPSATELARALRALEPRAAALLRRRLLDGESAEACAALYGVSREALDVHLLRALLALEGAGAAALPGDAREELAWAQRLAAGLGRPGEAPGAALAAHLVRLAPQVRAELARAALEEAHSPRHRRKEWLRRAAIALLVAFTGWYYLHRAPAEPPPSEARPR